jgi:hypothetical protein
MSARGNEARNPKPEDRKKAETRKGPDRPIHLAAGIFGYSEFGIRISFGLRASAFGFKPHVAGFGPALIRHSGPASSGSQELTFGARSFVGPRRLAAGGPRAPFQQQQQQQKKVSK